MTQERGSKLEHAARRFFRALSLMNPRRVVRHFRSVSHRLNELALLINPKSAQRVEDGISFVEVCMQRLGRLEDAIRDMASKVDHIADVQGSAIEAIRGDVAHAKRQFDSLNLDRWKLQEFEGILRHLRRQEQLRAVELGSIVVPHLETEHPIAVSSNDTKFPRGSKNDNSIAPRFNRKLYELFNGKQNLRVLDIGCAGGGFVRSLIDDGHFAVGLDGSDYPLLNQCGEWPTISEHLFTCDVTKPFTLSDRATGEPLEFDAITAWELMEHIPAESLPRLFENIERHLAPGGLLLFSVATFLDWDRQTGVVWHVTVKPQSWWEDRFDRLGFEVLDQHPFGKDDWLRGSGQCRGDWHEDDGMGFHVVLKRKATSGIIGQPTEQWRVSVA